MMLTIPAAAAQFGLSEWRLYQWRRTRTIRFVNLGTEAQPDYRVTPEWVEAAIAAHTVEPRAKTTPRAPTVTAKPKGPQSTAEIFKRTPRPRP